MSAPTQAQAQAEVPARYRHGRPTHWVAWWALLAGLALGLTLGLGYAWVVDPVQEVDTAPRQLLPEARGHYLVAIALSFAHTSDLQTASQRLVETLPGNDPFQQAADVACTLARSGYANDSNGLRGLRALMTFYQLQGRQGCADALVSADAPMPTTVAIVLPTPTFAPVPSKTPTPEATRAPTSTAAPIVVPTRPPQQQFVLVNVATFCSVPLSGLIEVYVQDRNGQGLPGQAVRVRWSGGEDTFFSGLKPERGPAYADFQMEAGRGYTIEMPGRSDPSSRALEAVPCTTPDGEAAVTSYRVTFRPS